MPDDKTVAAHYSHGNLLRAIESALVAIGKSMETVTVTDLAPVDEFHIGGRVATDHLLAQMKLTKNMHLLDVGCGLGGAARYVAQKHNISVTGIDLTDEYIETGQVLTQWLGLQRIVQLMTSNALSMPFKNNSFSGGYMLHVGMNIADKLQLFKEIYRVIEPGATFAVYEIMRNEAGELTYPVPWASDETHSYLATTEQYTSALCEAGFSINAINNRRDFALHFFKDLQAKTEKNGGPPPIGLHILMQDSFAIKIPNMVQNLSNDLIVPVEIIAAKPV